MYHILTVCTGNICRSPMAEGLLKHLLPQHFKDRITVGSAGTHGLHGHQPSPFAVEALQEWGIDIRNHRARQLNRDLVRRADLILTMEKMHLDMVCSYLLFNKSRVKLLTHFGPPYMEPEVEDPYGQPLKAYQECLKVLHPCINGVIRWLVNEGPMAENKKRLFKDGPS